MKVVCTNNEKSASFGTLPITVGKIYEAVIEDFGNGTTYYLIEDDLGYIGPYDSARFLTIEKWRESRLKGIGILDEVEIPQKSGI
jgi:hypothetical protein